MKDFKKLNKIYLTLKKLLPTRTAYKITTLLI